MELERFCTFFELTAEAKHHLAADWENLTVHWQGEIPPFIDKDFFKKYYPHCAIAFPLEELLPQVEKVIQIVHNHPEAAFLAHVISYSNFELKSTVPLGFLPDILPHFGEEYSGIFSLMISVGSCPFIEKAYAALGLPPHYAFDTMKWIGGSLQAYGAAHNGRPGRPFQFSWIRNYISRKLFRIGRLEYLLHPCPEWLPLIYRNAAQKIAVLAPENWHFRADGYRTAQPEKSVFTTCIAETESTITGTPILPDGKVDFSRTLTLDKTQWFPAVSPWDLCPSLHIPGGSRLSFEEVQRSLQEAVIFFDTYFQRHVPLFGCCSWLLNPAWEEYLPDSNIARFRREFYAVPGPDWGSRAGMTFIFGRADMDPDLLPCENAVQKAFLQAWQKDQTGIGTIFVLRQDIPQLGNEFYRKLYS